MKISNGPKSRRGAMLPLVAILLPVMLILACFVVNVAYMELTRTELRIANDSATRAAGHALMTTGNEAQARLAAIDGLTRNKVAGQATKLGPSDIEFGVSRRAALDKRYAFTPGGSEVNSVRVVARRDAGSLSGTVGMIVPSFGAAKQFGPVQQAISTQVELDVALVLDRSGSMAYGAAENSSAMAAANQMPALAPPGWQFCDPAPKGSRWLDLVGGVDIFLAELAASPQEEFIALATYSDASKLDTTLSRSTGPIVTAMGSYTAKYCQGSTNIHDGLVEGINAVSDPRLGRPWAIKAVIVMTDGRHNTGPDPTAAAQQASSKGVTVYSVTFSDEADQARMKKVAEIGGGKHVHASNGSELREAFREIARRLPTLLTN